jgi:hypothetical protein
VVLSGKIYSESTDFSSTLRHNFNRSTFSVKEIAKGNSAEQEEKSRQ